jgi:hypothetical protein
MPTSNIINLLIHPRRKIIFSKHVKRKEKGQSF